MYSLWCLIWLKLFGTMTAITVGQHLLGLGVGCLILWNWGRLLDAFLKPSRLTEGLRLVGILLAGLYWFSLENMVQEHMLGPEALYGFLSMLLLTAFISVCLKTDLEGAGRRTFWLMWWTVCCYALRPKLGLGVGVLLMAAIVVEWLLHKQRLKAVLRPVVCCLVSAVVLLGPDRWLAERHDPLASICLSRQLLWFHLPEIEPIMQADAEAEGALGAPPELLQQLLQDYRHDVANNPE